MLTPRLLNVRLLLVTILGACSTCVVMGCQSAAATPNPARPAVNNDATYDNAAIATDHRLASQAGLEMLEQGGNAIDAAVAASFTLSVVRPYSCGIGGGGFMVIHIPAADEDDQSEQLVINYREIAPAAVDGDYYVELDQDEASRFGVHAVGVPGNVAGLLYALQHYGTLDRETVLAPAIRAAEDGFQADAHHIWAMNHLKDLLEERPERGEHFDEMWSVLFNRGELREGEIIRNPQKANTLRLIVEQGHSAFYYGEIGDAIVEVMRDSNGPIAHEDLRRYTVDITMPLHGSFIGYELLTMPPPSSGGVAMIQTLGLIERAWEKFDNPAHNSPAYVHLIAEAFKHAFADRAEWLADSAFVDVPVDRLMSEAYLDELAARIDPEQTLDDRFAYGSVRPANDNAARGGGTSHLSVIDENGMAVAVTETINLVCGSLVEVPGYGFMLNNEMDDFTTVPGAPNVFGLRQSDRNLPEPGKRPLSSMSPTIVLDGDRAVLVAGASGGPRIITGTLQVMLNCLLFEMTPGEAVRRPRFHHQWMPEELMFEAEWGDAKTQAWIALKREMERFGHEVGSIAEVGVVQVIRAHEDGYRAASDPRKGGEPAGY